MKGLKLSELLVTAATVLALASSAHADFSLPRVPAKFQGTWISAEYKDDAPIVIGAKSVFGKCDITKIVPADEDGKSISVTWKCSEYPKMLPVEVIWKLTKVGGQEVLMQINTECGACSVILRRMK